MLEIILVGLRHKVHIKRRANFSLKNERKETTWKELFILGYNVDDMAIGSCKCWGLNHELFILGYNVDDIARFL